MARIHGVESIFGGQDFYDDHGNLVGYSVDSVLGNGQNFYTPDGKHVGYSVDSAFGGRDYYGPNGSRSYSVPSVLGGEDIYGDISGYSVDSPFGGSGIFLDEDS